MVVFSNPKGAQNTPQQVAVLRGLALQLTRFHAAAGRNGKLPPEVMRALTREQKDIVDSFLDV